MKSIYFISIILSCVLVFFYFNANGTITVIEKQSTLEDRIIRDLAVYEITSNEDRKHFYFSNLSIPNQSYKSDTSNLPYSITAPNRPIRNTVYISN